MKIGYIRVSTQEQNLSLQHDALQAAGCELIYEEKMTGTHTNRPELQNCLKSLRKGDTLVVWKLDRLGRSLKDLIGIVNDLHDRGVAFQALTNQLDTSSASGKLFFHIFGALAEYEAGIIKERTNAGLAAARARGRFGGRPGKLSKKDIHKAMLLLKDPAYTVTAVAAELGVGRNTLYRYLKEAGYKG